MPHLIIDNHLREIARRIKAKTAVVGRSGWVWNEDEFQLGYFCGGFVPEPDVGPPAFYFSFYAPDGNDYIFSMTFEDVDLILDGKPFDPPLEYWKESPFGRYNPTDASPRQEEGH